MVQPATLFPDALSLAVAHLGASMPDVHVGTRVPNPRLADMVLLRRIGGLARNGLIDDARIDGQVWAASDEDATEFANRARYFLATLGEVEPRVRQFAEEVGPTLIPDGDSSAPRVLFTVVLSVRGRVPAS